MLTPTQMKRIRKKAKLSQEQVAKAMGITRQTYSKIEKNPELMTIKQYKIFGRITFGKENDQTREVG